MSVSEEEEFVSTRYKAVIGLFGCLAFVAISAWAWLSGDASWKLQAGGVFFALCALVFLVMVLRPHRLKLDPQGFTLSGGLMRTARKTGWGDVREFYVRRLGHGSKMAAFTYAEEASVPFNGALGRSGGIPGVWSGGPEEIVWRLNQYRNGVLGRS